MSDRQRRYRVLRRSSAGVILTMVLGLLGNTAAGKDSPAPAFRPDIKALGMGGAFVAAASDANALVYNPALLGRAGFDLVVSSLRFRLDNDFLNVADFLLDHQDDFALYDTLYSGHLDTATVDQLDSFLHDITPYENRWGKTRFAPMFRLSVDNFGFGIYNVTDVWIKADKGVYNPRAYGQAVSDMVVLGGYAQEISQKITLGVSGKFVSRRTSGLVRISSTDLGGTNEVLKPAYDRLKSEELGGGLDLGVLYAYRPHLDFGLVLQDAASWIGDRRIYQNLKVGTAYSWRGFPLPSISNGIVAADIEDLLFTSGEAFFNRLHMGTSATFLGLSLRAGLNQGYPTAGVGLNLFIFNIDYAYYGEELGPHPGQREEWYHTLELTIGL